MATSRFFEWFPLAALACWGALGLTRAFLFRARGVSVIAADRQRTTGRMLVDILALGCLLLWVYEVVAYAWPLGSHVGPAILTRSLVDSIAVKSFGTVIVCGALLLYAVALRDLGGSWRLGIDRTASGPLVTDGVYRWSRHPIYVAFDLVFVGTFLVLGRLMFLVLAVMWMVLMHVHMRREEDFLAHLYGDVYRNYCARVGRYLLWPW